MELFYDKLEEDKYINIYTPMQLLLYRTVRPHAAPRDIPQDAAPFGAICSLSAQLPKHLGEVAKKFLKGVLFAPLKCKICTLQTQTNVRLKRKKDELSFASPVLATLDQGYFPSVDRMFAPAHLFGLCPEKQVIRLLLHLLLVLLLQVLLVRQHTQSRFFLLLR